MTTKKFACNFDILFRGDYCYPVLNLKNIEMKIMEKRDAGIKFTETVKKNPLTSVSHI